MGGERDRYPMQVCRPFLGAWWATASDPIASDESFLASTITISFELRARAIGWCGRRRWYFQLHRGRVATSRLSILGWSLDHDRFGTEILS
jgi:hypothetical protein